MTDKPYDLVVFIGRFQIVHNAHKAIINRACELAKYKVLVIVGSADKPRTYKNPFTTNERKAMIKSVTALSTVPVYIDHIYDNTYNDTAWAAQVQRVVNDHASRPWTDKGMRIAIIGHKSGSVWQVFILLFVTFNKFFFADNLFVSFFTSNTKLFKKSNSWFRNNTTNIIHVHFAVEVQVSDLRSIKWFNQILINKIPLREHI